MTDEELRIAIAKICGWNTEKEVLGGVFIYHDPSGNIAAALPDYVHDLNAMHQAETTIDTEINLIDDSDGFESARDRYLNKLQEITDARPTHQDDCEWALITANARQRAEAFIATLAK